MSADEMTAHFVDFDFGAFFSTLYEAAPIAQAKLNSTRIVFVNDEMSAFLDFVRILNDPQHQRAFKLLINSNIYRQFFIPPQLNANWANSHLQKKRQKAPSRNFSIQPECARLNSPARISRSAAFTRIL